MSGSRILGIEAPALLWRSRVAESCVDHGVCVCRCPLARIRVELGMDVWKECSVRKCMWYCSAVQNVSGKIREAQARSGWGLQGCSMRFVPHIMSGRALPLSIDQCSSS